MNESELDGIKRRLAEQRGDMMAVLAVATFALNHVIANSPDPQAYVDDIEKTIDRALDNMSFGPGDAWLTEVTRETARFRAHDAVAAIRQSIMGQ